MDNNSNSGTFVVSNINRKYRIYCKILRKIVIRKMFLMGLGHEMRIQFNWYDLIGLATRRDYG
jgi:hypothetical protein